MMRRDPKRPVADNPIAGASPPEVAVPTEAAVPGGAVPGGVAAATEVDEQDGPERLPEASRNQGGPPHAMMGRPVEKSLNFWPSTRRLLGWLIPERLKALAVVVLAVIAVVLSVVAPLILGRAMDIIFGGSIGSQLPGGGTRQQVLDGLRASGDDRMADMLSTMPFVPGRGIDFDHLGRTLLVVLVLYVLSSAFQWLTGFLLNDVVQSTVRRMRQTVERKLHRLPLAYFDRRPRGEILSRVTNDIDNIAQTLTQTLSQLLTALLTVIGVVVMMFVISPLLALIALVTIPLSGLVTALIGKRSQKKFIAQWTHTGELNGQIEEAFTGHELVKVFGRQKEVSAEFARTNEKLYEAAFGAQFISGMIMPIMFFIGNLNYVAIAVIGGLRITSGAMTLGEVQAFIQYSQRFTQPLTQVASMANLLQSGVASAERVFSLMDAAEESPEPAENLDEPGPGRVEFEHISFSYKKDQPLITDLSLIAEPGQTVAIVGPTGAGKTTLVNLIMRFYELDAGRITLDGVDIAELPRQQLRERIGMVLQDSWLFGGTIRDNIAYGKPSASEEEILAAARATYVDRFVHSLPDGYDTVIDEEASNVSAGEKQLITIARAFISQPSLLILDEATSSVDTRTELLVQKAMSALRSDRTSFVIAHRLSTIRDADLILVMEDGAIVEQGTHDALLEQHGAYWRLYNAQFTAAVAAE
ncbi:ABC transporter ATP-binding protein [Blastococcus sp. Marseille-P5729]|uniref:ABC transporter ATP-binding protein n=1 Tax=Blastococcus sp. Marseille-P5729 TaxID=2086582 RepID=UPI001F1867ED|nr:ABC transporter ATP-binding protein [Blastococcus sp. Marseille-P5729]